MYKWKLKSAATAGMILLPLPMHFCLENISGMLTLVCVFVHVQMDTEICDNSWYAPPPLTHALLPAPRSGMLTLVCVFVHVQMETQICGNSGYDPPPLTHALLPAPRSGMP